VIRGRDVALLDSSRRNESPAAETNVAHNVTETERASMNTFTAYEPTTPSIEALLDRLDPAAPDSCTVPGCRHHHADRAEATWVG
jgi:hypothetical protein